MFRTHWWRPGSTMAVASPCTNMLLMQVYLRTNGTASAIVSILSSTTTNHLSWQISCTNTTLVITQVCAPTREPQLDVDGGAFLSCRPATDHCSSRATGNYRACGCTPLRQAGAGLPAAHLLDLYASRRVKQSFWEPQRSG